VPFAFQFGHSSHRYRYQLEAFIDKLRGRTPEHWHDAQDSISNIEWIEAVYKEVCRLVSSLAETDKCIFSDWTGIKTCFDSRGAGVA
jgi:hypothetical protein